MSRQFSRSAHLNRLPSGSQIDKLDAACLSFDALETLRHVVARCFTQVVDTRHLNPFRIFLYGEE